MHQLMSDRFRGFLPVVVDVETGGFNSETDALLEIGAVILSIDQQRNWSRRQKFCLSSQKHTHQQQGD